MPPTAEDRISDTLLGIEKIQRLTGGMTVAQFADDELVRAATERFLEIVCDASRRLPDSVKQNATTIDWRRMNDFANLLRHATHATEALHPLTGMLFATPRVRRVSETRRRD